jgi:hypothetical protein
MAEPLRSLFLSLLLFFFFHNHFISIFSFFEWNMCVMCLLSFQYGTLFFFTQSNDILDGGHCNCTWGTYGVSFCVPYCCLGVYACFVV